MKKILLYISFLFIANFTFSQVKVGSSGNIIATGLYPVVNSSDIKGTLHLFHTLIDRDALPMNFRDTGMLAYVIDSAKFFYLNNGLTNSYWTVWQGSGGSGGCPLTFYTTPDSLYYVRDSCGVLDTLQVVGDGKGVGATDNLDSVLKRQITPISNNHTVNFGTHNFVIDSLGYEQHTAYSGANKAYLLLEGGDNSGFLVQGDTSTASVAVVPDNGFGAIATLSSFGSTTGLETGIFLYPDSIIISNLSGTNPFLKLQVNNLDSSNANPNNIAWFDSHNIMHRGYLAGGSGGSYHLPFNGVTTDYLGGDTTYHALNITGLIDIGANMSKTGTGTLADPYIFSSTGSGGTSNDADSLGGHPASYYLHTETDPIVKAINGIIKSNGSTISAATAGTDYLTPTGSAAGLTSFPTFNQSTTGNAETATKLATSRTIAGVSFDGTSNISLNNNAITNGANYLTATGSAAGLTSFPTLNQSTTGNAATATKLATARNIAGVAFDGTTSISLNNASITNGAGYATLVSPNFTGTPLAPTPISTDNSTKIATTAFVNSYTATDTLVYPLEYIPGTGITLAQATGQTTLVSGTKSITISGVRSSSTATLGFVSIGGTVSTTWQYKVVCSTNTIVITAISNTGSTDTSDTSTLNYSVTF